MTFLWVAAAAIITVCAVALIFWALIVKANFVLDATMKD